MDEETKLPTEVGGGDLIPDAEPPDEEVDDAAEPTVTPDVPAPEVTDAAHIPESAVIAPKTHVLTEALDLTEATVDADTRTIRNVKLITAGMSLNRRFYSDTVLSKAAPIFEGLKAYADHPAPKSSGRSIRDLTGWYENVRFDGKRLTADRHFLDNAAGNDVFAIARAITEKRAPASLAGLSINAIGTGKSRKFDDGDALEVESITSAMSVDDVDNPAAGGGYLLTASGDDPLVKGVMEALSYQEWFDARPDYRKRLQNEIKDVRKDDVIRAAEAVADTLRTDLSTAQSALSEAQAALTTAQSDHAAAAALWATERRGLLIEAALTTAKLPTLYTADLRERLSKLDESEWDGVITIEKQKASRRPVTGSGQQVNSQPVMVQPVRRGVDPLNMLANEASFAEGVKHLRG